MCPIPPPELPEARADDWGRYATAYAPHEASNGANHSLNATPGFTTPNFDRLAAEGALFLNALVVRELPPCPLPPPSRAAHHHHPHTDTPTH